ncbi:MAG: sugar ABC transporter ATP-binding protein [Victivallales bacterium]|nr:sugar ABC transporter ATP-binding protein [Victivallales bacterium]
MPPENSQNLLELVDVHKSYGSVEVLHGVSLALGEGDILGLIGENGAGKSTLMKCLNGMEQVSGGRIIYLGSPFHATTVADAVKGGIITIPQEFNLVKDLKVYENIFLGNELRGCLGLLDVAAMRTRSKELLDELGAAVDVDSLVEDLSVAARQMVEVAKALSYSAKLLIMDEPTTVLNHDEVQVLFGVIRRLKANGTSVIFISHKLREVLEICDKVAVLRDGELVSFSGIEGLDEAELARRMVGRSPSQMFTEKRLPAADAEVALEVSHLSVEGLLKDISFSIRRGEILGFAGLVGSGRTELAETIYGVRRANTGCIRLFGKEVKLDSPRKALDSGIAYLPEDRQGTGILTNFSVASNVTLSSLKRYCQPLISPESEIKAAQGYVEAFHIKTPGTETLLCDLSGGNQQKVAIAKGLDCKPSVFIFDEPTRGIDIKAKSEVYAFINSLLKQGLACMLISSDLEEVIGLCSRIAVMREGALAGELAGDDISEEAIMYLASGVHWHTSH